MSRSAQDFLVYACSACGKRVFTDPSHMGRHGKCPLCGAKHVVGGPKMAKPGKERRQSARVKIPSTQVALQRHRSQKAHKDDLLANELFALEDLSETGVSFRLPGVKDARSISGTGAPLKAGDSVQVTLHLAGRPRILRAEVCRVIPPKKRGGELFLVGARFRGLSGAQQEDLHRLVESLLDAETD